MVQRNASLDRSLSRNAALGGDDRLTCMAAELEGTGSGSRSFGCQGASFSSRCKGLPDLPISTQFLNVASSNPPE